MRNNINVMLSLLSDAKTSGIKSALTEMLFTCTVVLSVIMDTMWFVYLFTVVGLFAFLGMRLILDNICDPRKIKSFVDKWKYTDKELMLKYSLLKRPDWLTILQIILHTIETTVIIVYGGMLYLGLIWLVIAVLNENVIYNHRAKMKGMWDDRELTDPDTV